MRCKSSAKLLPHSPRKVRCPLVHQVSSLLLQQRSAACSLIFSTFCSSSLPRAIRGSEEGRRCAAGKLLKLRETSATAAGTSPPVRKDAPRAMYEKGGGPFPSAFALDCVYGERAEMATVIATRVPRSSDPRLPYQVADETHWRNR